MDDTIELMEVMGSGRSEKPIGRFLTREAAADHAAGLDHGTYRVRHPDGVDIVVVDQDGKAVVVRAANTPDQIESLIRALCNLPECESFPTAVFQRVCGGNFPYEQHPRKGREGWIFFWDLTGSAEAYKDLAEQELMVLAAYHLMELLAYWTIVKGPVQGDGRDDQRLYWHSDALSGLRSALTPDKFDLLFGALVEDREERTLRLVRKLLEQDGLPIPPHLPDPDTKRQMVVGSE